MAPKMTNPVEPTRLIATPDPRMAGRFTARLEGEVIVTMTRQPLVDGARELLARGFDPATPLTMRMQERAYDSFQPMPIGKWAEWTYEEGEKTALQRRPWRPFGAGTGHQKSACEASVAPEGRGTENRFHGEQPQPTTRLGRAA
jgi:hypothetical protein